MLQTVAVAAMAWMLIDTRFAHDLASQSLVFLGALFIACMFCHGELAGALLVLVSIVAAGYCIRGATDNVIAMNRNFYGVLRVREYGSAVQASVHQRTLAHGGQVGIVGLGAGTLAAYGRSGDAYTFFEIDPAIVDAARQHFTYLADTAAVEVLAGDGRLLLQLQRLAGSM